MKKGSPTIYYGITSLLIVAVATYYLIFFQKQKVQQISSHAYLVQVATQQQGYAQQLAKATLGIGSAESRKKFVISQNELRRILEKIRVTHEALVVRQEGLENLADFESEEYLRINQATQSAFRELSVNARGLASLEFGDQEGFDQYAPRFLDSAIRYRSVAENFTNYLVNSAQTMPGVGWIERIVLLLVLLFIGLQGWLAFRPLIRKAGETHEIASKQFKEVVASEKKFKVGYVKQRKINKILFESKKELEAKNKELLEKVDELERRSAAQLATNNELLTAQEEAKIAYQKLQDSEKEMREMVDKQLQDNEKLFLAEKKLQSMLDQEKKNRTELSDAMESLKSTQSKLVHSEKMASLGQLTAGIAHEINNPINFISSGMSSMKMTIESLIEILEEYSRLDKGDDPKKVKKDVIELKEDHEYDELMDEIDDLIKDINYGVARTVEIVKGLRVFSRLDEEEVKPANVNDNLDATLTLLRNKTKNRIKISKYYDENMKDIECYPGQLNQVFMNILSNGIQAIPEDRVDGELTIYTEYKDELVEIRIKDNGTGIPEDIKDRIWEPFFTTKAVGVGTGLGMSITYGIVEKHNGQIEFESEDGKGTEFVITLPKKVEIKKEKKEKAVKQKK